MRPRLEVVPRAVAAAQGAEGKVLTRTGINGAMLATAACRCGPGRVAGARYVCLTCAAFARIGKRIETRAPLLHSEVRHA